MERKLRLTLAPHASAGEDLLRQGEILREGQARWLVRFGEEGIPVVCSRNKAQDDMGRLALVPTRNNLSSTGTDQPGQCERAEPFDKLSPRLRAKGISPRGFYELRKGFR